MTIGKAEMQQLEGTVERVTFYNPENGFSVVKLRVRGQREPIAVVGTLPSVQPGETLVLAGRWETDRRHGAQFRPETAELRVPSTVEEIVRYLGSGLIRQLGPVLAQRIVAAFGERTLEVLDTRPGRVRDVPGIGPERARALAAAWAEHRALRAVAAFLSEHRIDTRFAPRLVAAYGLEAPKVLAANPYRLVGDLPALGFTAADRLGRALGVRPTAPARLQAAVQAALVRASEGGHTRLSREALVAAAIELSGVETELVAAAVTQLLAAGTIAVSVAGGPPSELANGPGDLKPTAAGGRLRVYEPRSAYAAPPSAPDRPPDTGIGSSLVTRHPSPVTRHPDRTSEVGIGLSGLVRAEETLAARLVELARRGSGLSPEVVDTCLGADSGALDLSDDQRAAVRAAALSGCFVLTGGPGVGKTTTVRALVHCLQALRRSVALAAPTGKAAKRLGEVVGLEARTIHRLLGAGPQGFRHGPAEPLPFDTVIVDEASMLDTALARSLVSAVGRRSQLVFVGDADQLPSVGPGQVLRDLLDSRLVPSVCLQQVFRQAAQSQIVANAHRIRRGERPDLASASALGRSADCVFVPASPERVAEVGTAWAVERLPKLLGIDCGDVQVLAPLTRVCQTMNSLLQARLNPARGQAERPHGALALRVGDRVIQTRNNYDLGVFNGDTGVIVGIGPDDLSVDFGDGRVGVYAAADALDLDHAYCLTVHRAQGSEWPGVVILISSSYGPMLSRNLLYTALTRARRAAVLVGDQTGIARAVAETRDAWRNTGLPSLLTSGERSDGIA